TGFRADIGSWKIIEMRLPRILRISSSGRVTRSFPSNSMRLPASMRPGGWISRSIESAVTDFPHPDSPTMPTVSPSPTSNETPPTGAKSLRRGDEFRVFQRKNLTSDDATEPEPASQSEEQNESANREVGPGDEDAEHQQQSRNRKKRVQHPHHECVECSAHVAGDSAVRNADRETDDCRQNADHQRQPRSIEYAAQHVATVRIGSEGVRQRGRQILERYDVGLRGGIVRCNEGCQCADEYDHAE